MAGDSPDSPLEASSPSSALQNKRLKTMSPEQSELLEHLFGSQQLQEPSMDNESGSLICGICLSDGRKSIVGRIDSCDHFFCFVCIMEWAKVESRCPTCKRRFTSIRRPPKHGVFPCERVVNVPRRDQVYHLSGNASTTHSDPYGETHCTFCHSTADESLLLLCDLCDSAAHTFCVGLGHTVPEGDWFCQDCAVTRAEHQKTETDIENESKIIPEESFVPSPADPLVSVFDIVRESDGPSLATRALPRIDSLLNDLSSIVHSGCETISADGEIRAWTRTHQSHVGEPSASCARTLVRCRNVQSRIQTLRINWNGFRNGSLKFSSGSGECCGENDNLGPSFGASNRQTSAYSRDFGFSGQKNDPYDTNKAWKMMKMAKSIKRNVGRANGVSQFTKVVSGKGHATAQPFKIRSSVYLSEKQQSKIKPDFCDKKIDKQKSQILGKQKQILGLIDVRSDSCSLANSMGSTAGASDSSRIKREFAASPTSRVSNPEVKVSSEKGSAERQSRKNNYTANMHGSLKSKKPKQSMGLSRLSFRQDKELPKSSSQFRECPLPREVQIRMNLSDAGTLSDSMHRISSESYMQSGSGYLAKSHMSRLEASDPSRGKAEFIASSSSRSSVVEGKLWPEKRSSKKQASKREIQSLVKLNMKLLGKGKQLEVNKFKEIARLSTHTILAACGLEHSKPGIHSFPSSICNHTSQRQQLHRSTLMPSSCRECFYAFVEDTVKSIMEGGREEMVSEESC